MSFKEGSAIIHCAAPSNEDVISTEVFNEAFPQWITNLQLYANDGIVARAHYLGGLKRGIFIVVLGETSEQAMDRAVSIQQENRAILAEAIVKADAVANEQVDAVCQIFAIGPLAAKSMN